MDNNICARFGLFLLVFYTNIYFLDAVEVYIFNSSEYSMLGWTIYPQSPDGNTYSGWTETGASYSRTYQICQVSQQDGNYWLRTPWMPRNHANRIHVKIDFSMYSCQSISNAELQVCKETFEIYYYESDTDTATATDPPWTSEAYTKIKRIAADGRFSDPDAPAHQVINHVDEHFPVSRGGFYIALRDQGACMALVKIEVYYVVCPFVVMNFARFEKTTTASTETDLVPVHGMCVANSQVTGVQDPVYQCQGKGDWVLIQGACGCSPGYEPGEDGISCQECDFNTYKPDVGDKACTSCPKDSHANAKGSSKCTCVQGRYRTEEEDADHDCTGPPLAPRNLRALVDNKSSVVTLSWWPPENDGDRKDVSYWISCPRCPKEVEFSPGKYGIHGLEVNVSRLESHTSYEFRVHSKNGVSEASRVDNYVSVNATTFSSVPSAVRDVTVRDKGRSRNSVELEWKEPMYPNGQITSYQIRYRTSMETVANSKYHYQSSQHGRIQRTKVIGLDAGTEYVFEVSAGTTVGYGSYSKPVVATTKGAPSSNSYATAMIAGAVSAFFVILILVAVVIFLVFWRRRKAKQQLYFKISTLPPTSRKKELPPHENGMIYSNGANGEATVILPHISKCRTYIDPLTYEDPNQAVKEFATEIDANCIRILEVIGGGEFGDVCAALMLTPEKMTCKVAVKTLKTTSTDKDRNDFLSEASIMGQFDDPNVIKLMGVITRTRPAMIVTEFMENGSLDTFLRDNDGKLTVMQLLGMMGGIASGMRYLSEMNFVHRDLAARNILINSNMVCKVADFGLSRRKSEGAYETTGGKIPIRWTAPEAIAYKKFTSASDVWSYGVVIWEIMSYGERPYWNWPNQDVIKAVEKGYRLPPPMDCPEALHQLMLDCWQKDRNHRPTFSTIVATLDRLIRNPNALRPLAKATASPLGSSTTDINCLHDVSEWLDSIKMGRYKDDFTQAGYIRLEDIARLSQHDLPRLGVTLVGHQKKIMKSINTIRAQLETAEETLV